VPATTAVDLFAALVLEDGHRWGEVAHDFQLADAAAVLEPASVAPMHFLTRPRGASKTTDLAGIAVAALLEQLPDGAQGYAVASDRDQARLLVAEMAGFARRTPELAGALQVESWRVAARSGAAITALAADGPGAYGLRPHLVIADELAQWSSTPGPRDVWQAVVSAVPKVAAGRLVVLTTAGDPAHWSARVRDHALVSPRWRVHEVPGPCPWIDPGALAEQRALLAPSAFARLHLNQWTAAEDRLTTVDDLRACVTLDGPLAPARGIRYVIGLDLGLTNDRAVAAVAHADQQTGTDLSPWLTVEGAATAKPKERSSTRVVLDRLEVWAGSRANPVRLETVEAWLIEAHRAYGNAPVVYDPFQAVGMAQRLERRGIRAEAFTFSSTSVGRLASTLYRLLRDHQFALPDDRELLDELANVRLRETSPGVFRMDHDPGQHDDRAIALALAAHRLLEAPERSRRVVAW
jgi:phage terminase large subunit-like protein